MKISDLSECEKLPYAILKSIRTNSLKPMNRKTFELIELGTDVSFLCKSESTQLQSLVDKYQHLFANDNDTPGGTDLVEHHIDLVEGSRPFKQLSRRFSIHLQEEADKEVKKCSTPELSNLLLVNSHSLPCSCARKMVQSVFA